MTVVRIGLIWPLDSAHFNRLVSATNAELMIVVRATADAEQRTLRAAHAAARRACLRKRNRRLIGLSTHKKQAIEVPTMSPK